MSSWTPERIKELREAGYDETQEEFRHRLGVGVEALRFWEQGKGEPNGSARILLEQLDRSRPKTATA